MFYMISNYKLIYSDIETYYSFNQWDGWIEVPGHNNYYMTYNNLPIYGYNAKQMVIVKAIDANKTVSPIADIDINKYELNRASEIIKSYKFKKALERL